MTEPALTLVAPAIGAPKLHQHHQRQLVDVESELYEASTELVYQRQDLVEAASDENNRALEAALRVDGLPPLARQYIEKALAAEIDEDAAIRRAQQRRDQAHGHTKSAAGRLEVVLTGRGAADVDASPARNGEAALRCP